MKGICERCGKEYVADRSYDEWIGREPVLRHLCYECFEADRDVLVDAILQGEKLAPRMGYGKLRRP